MLYTSSVSSRKATPCALLQKEASQRQQRQSAAPASEYVAVYHGIPLNVFLFIGKMMMRVQYYQTPQVDDLFAESADVNLGDCMDETALMRAAPRPPGESFGMVGGPL